MVLVSICQKKFKKLKKFNKFQCPNRHKIDSENSVTLGIETDNKLNFEKHVTADVRKPTANLMPYRIHKYIGFQEMKMLSDSFVLSNFNYCPLVWHFCSATLSQKIEKIE